jgi:hypothetical protein
MTTPQQNIIEEIKRRIHIPQKDCECCRNTAELLMLFKEVQLKTLQSVMPKELEGYQFGTQEIGGYNYCRQDFINNAKDIGIDLTA